MSKYLVAGLRCDGDYLDNGFNSLAHALSSGSYGYKGQYDKGKIGRPQGYKVPGSSYVSRKWVNGKWQYVYSGQNKSPKVSEEYRQEKAYNSQKNNYFGRSSSTPGSSAPSSIQSKRITAKPSTISSPKVSKEYAEEQAYNSRKNDYFGQGSNPGTVTYDSKTGQTVPVNPQNTQNKILGNWTREDIANQLKIPEQIIPEQIIPEQIIPEERITEQRIPGVSKEYDEEQAYNSQKNDYFGQGSSTEPRVFTFNSGTGKTVPVDSQNAQNSSQNVWDKMRNVGNAIGGVANKVGDTLGNAAYQYSDWWGDRGQDLAALLGLAQPGSRAYEKMNIDADPNTRFIKLGYFPSAITDEYLHNDAREDLERTNKINEFRDNVGQTAQNAWNGISNFAQNAWNNAGNTIQNVGNSIGNAATNAWNGITDRVDDARRFVEDAPYNLRNSAYDLRDNASIAAHEASKALGNAAGKAADFAQNAWNNAGNTIQNVGKSIGNAATNAWNGVSGAAQNVGGIVSGAAQNALNEARRGTLAASLAVTPNSNRIVNEYSDITRQIATLVRGGGSQEDIDNLLAVQATYANEMRRRGIKPPM